MAACDYVISAQLRLLCCRAIPSRPSTRDAKSSSMTSLQYVYENSILAWTNLLMDPWISPPSSTIALPLFLTTCLSYLWSESLVPSRGLELLIVNPYARHWTRKNLGKQHRRTSLRTILCNICQLWQRRPGDN